MLTPVFEHLSKHYLGGLAPDQLQVVTCLFLAYPLAHLFRALPTTAHQRHLFSVISTVGVWLVVVGQISSVLHVLFMSGASYAIILNVKHRHMPLLVLALTMGILSYNHVHRMWLHFGESKQDHTGPMMILVQKLSSLAFNVNDGRQLAIQEKKTAAAEQQQQQQNETTSTAAAANGSAKKSESEQTKLTDYQLKHLVRESEIPTPLEFFGFVFFFAGFFAGPSFEFTQYRKLAHGTLYDGIAKRGSPSGRVTAGYRVFVRGLLCIALLVTVGARYNVSQVFEPWYAALPFHWRALYQTLFTATSRLPYYVAWSLAEGACIVAGLGFTGYDSFTGSPKWDGIAMVRIYELETAQSMKEVIDAWNVCTNIWLRRYVYERVKAPGKKTGTRATIITFMVSAFWHGFYPGYYFTFFFSSITMTVSRMVRRHVRPLFMPVDLAAADAAEASRKAAPKAAADARSTPSPRSTLVPEMPLDTPTPVPTPSHLPDLTPKLPAVSAKKDPPVSGMKRLYDIGCFVVTAIYVGWLIPPFLLLTYEKGMFLWNINYQWCNVLTAVAMVFFLAGGGRYFTKVQQSRIKDERARIAKAATAAIKKEY